MTSTDNGFNFSKDVCLHNAFLGRLAAVDDVCYIQLVTHSIKMTSRVLHHLCAAKSWLRLFWSLRICFDIFKIYFDYNK